MQARIIQQELKIPFRKICQLLGSNNLTLLDNLSPVQIQCLRSYAFELDENQQKEQGLKAIEAAKTKGQRRRERQARREAKHSPKKKPASPNPLNPNSYVFPQDVIKRGVIYTPTNGKVK
ncbi:hypothetical protein GCM10022409_21480 [Hymenobacter glaciei]|uniref:Uncharacterized protein n=1 Tax=Hymenobacter glaciei TaxID=877209 RepID=A0ABP7U595_9BACT